jgi:hypothetical protein
MRGARVVVGSVGFVVGVGVGVVVVIGGLLRVAASGADRVGLRRGHRATDERDGGVRGAGDAYADRSAVVRWSA